MRSFVSSCRTPSRFRCSRSTAAKIRSSAMGIEVSRDSSGRIVFTTRRSTGKIRSMYQFIASGSDSSRSVSAVGAQSTTSRS